MMRRFILAAAGLALLVPAALAQTAPAGGNPAPGATPAAAPAGAPGPVAGGPAVPPPPPGGLRGPGGPGGPGMMPPPPPPPSRAAHFHLQRGDAVVDVKCADDDTAKACADTVSAMLDKLAAMPAPARN